jgi:murein DD-endopeptidase MepM/ murein hydrolase activator NlpD
MKTWQKWMIGVLAVACLSMFFLSVAVRPREEFVEEPLVELEADTIPLPPSAYGIPMAGFVLEQARVQNGATFGNMLASQGISMNTVHSLVENAAPYFDVRRMRSGNPYAFIFPEDGSTTPAYFVYESSPVEYVVFALDGSLDVTVGQRPVELTEHTLACVVTGALYNDLARAGADPVLAVLLSEVFAWTIDFYRIQKDDVFSVTYREQTVDGERYGTPTILAARYTSGGKVKQAFRFDHDGGSQFFDDAGNSLRKAFLKAPLKFSRISSGFSQRRLHPVQKVMKAHLGTDYAAPYGTPILAVGDGVVEAAGHGSGNGNYVKIKHNGTYSTQYLHMRKILVKKGQRVSQGDVIGEVGSTGLATGPHVCFRFWKNGVQVDHRREEFPSSEPLQEELRPSFEKLRDLRAELLDAAELELVHGRLATF